MCFCKIYVCILVIISCLFYYYLLVFYFSFSGSYWIYCEFYLSQFLTYFFILHGY